MYIVKRCTGGTLLKESTCWSCTWQPCVYVCVYVCVLCVCVCVCNEMLSKLTQQLAVLAPEAGLARSAA